MSLYDILSAYGTAALVKVTGLVLLVCLLRLAVLPLALVTVLLDRAQRWVSMVLATVPAADWIPAPASSFGGETR